VLPWLLVVHGPLERGQVTSTCAHFGKCTLDIVRLTVDEKLRPRLRGSAPTRSPLDAFVDAVCGMHAAAIRAGLPPLRQWGRVASQWGDGTWGSKDWGVALAAPVESPDAAATVVAAFLHWLGCLPLEESIAVACKRCASNVNEVRVFPFRFFYLAHRTRQDKYCLRRVLHNHMLNHAARTPLLASRTLNQVIER
jgi:hypothetical protein